MTQRAGTRPGGATGPQAPAEDPGAARREAAEHPGGTVYLLHLDPAYKHARHYTGYAEPGNLQARLAAHAAGTGARLMQVIREAGGSFRLARTWPGSRTTERDLKDRHDAPRLCPICTTHPRPALTNDTARPQPARKAEPATAPPLARPPAYERGAAQARRAIQQQIDAGFSADRIAEVQARILSALVPERLRPETRDETRGYRETAEAMIAAHRQTTKPQLAMTEGEPARAQEGPTMSAPSAPGTLPVQPATAWMKGAKAARDLITRQVQAGRPPDRIAERWDQAVAAYDDATATPAQREWHAGAEHTARDLIQTWRDIHAAEAGQAHAARAQPQPQPEPELEAG